MAGTVISSYEKMLQNIIFNTRCDGSFYLFTAAFSDLPNDTVFHALQFLNPVPDLVRLRLVSRHWNEAILGELAPSIRKADLLQLQIVEKPNTFVNQKRVVKLFDGLAAHFPNIECIVVAMSRPGVNFLVRFLESKFLRLRELTLVALGGVGPQEEVIHRSNVLRKVRLVYVNLDAYMPGVVPLDDNHHVQYEVYSCTENLKEMRFRHQNNRYRDIFKFHGVDDPEDCAIGLVRLYMHEFGLKPEHMSHWFDYRTFSGLTADTIETILQLGLLPEYDILRFWVMRNELRVMELVLEAFRQSTPTSVFALYNQHFAKFPELFATIKAQEKCTEFFKLLIDEKEFFQHYKFLSELLVAALENNAATLFDLINVSPQPGVLQDSVRKLISPIISYILASQDDAEYERRLALMETMCGEPKTLWIANTLFIIVSTEPQDYTLKLLKHITQFVSVHSQQGSNAMDFKLQFMHTTVLHCLVSSAWLLIPEFSSRVSIIDNMLSIILNASPNPEALKNKRNKQGRTAFHEWVLYRASKVCPELQQRIADRLMPTTEEGWQLADNIGNTLLDQCLRGLDRSGLATWTSVIRSLQTLPIVFEDLAYTVHSDQLTGYMPDCGFMMKLMCKPELLDEFLLLERDSLLERKARIRMESDVANLATLSKCVIATESQFLVIPATYYLIITASVLNDEVDQCVLPMVLDLCLCDYSGMAHLASALGGRASRLIVQRGTRENLSPDKRLSSVPLSPQATNRTSAKEESPQPKAPELIVSPSVRTPSSTQQGSRSTQSSNRSIQTSGVMYSSPSLSGFTAGSSTSRPSTGSPFNLQVRSPLSAGSSASSSPVNMNWNRASPNTHHRQNY